MEVKEPDLSGNYTYADYMTWNWDQLAELIQGKVFKMSPAPNTKHQAVSGNLFGLIWSFLRGKKCRVFDAPFDVRLPGPSRSKMDQDIVNVVQPDICVICDLSKVDERGCVGPPDWIIEILSKYTSAKDIKLKFELYEEAGVSEYWVVHPEEQTVLVYVLGEDGKYKGTLRPYTQGDSVRSHTLEGLTIPLEEVFAD